MKSLEPAFVGIDVAIAKQKRLPVCIAVKRDGQLLPLPLGKLGSLRPPLGMGNRNVVNRRTTRQFASNAVRYVKAVAQGQRLRIARIAIDAPSDFCSPHLERREAESALAQAGIRFFVTPTAEQFESIKRKALTHIEQGLPNACIPHSNQLWMLAGFELFKQFSEIAECRETFPQAVVHQLNVADKYKGTSEGLERQLQAVCSQTGWAPGTRGQPMLNEIAFGSRHDKPGAIHKYARKAIFPYSGQATSRRQKTSDKR